MNNLTLLGSNNVRYTGLYDNSCLEAIERSLGRSSIKSYDFKGADIWHCYEFSHLDLNGVPRSYILKLAINASSPYIVESKSLKLYLFSFSETRFENLEQVLALIKRDLDNLLHTDIKIEAYCLNDKKCMLFNDNGKDEFKLIDTLAVDKITVTGVDDSLLEIDRAKIVSEKLCSNIVKTLCPVTSQPDYASIFIEYEGFKINRVSLLKYLISLRSHQGFHEQCTEMIFADILAKCECQRLKVTACFTRRGGIDINPIRSTDDFDIKAYRTIRQ